VLELARRLSTAGFHELGDRLEDAWRREVKVFGLGVADREAILRVLEDGPEGFGELRGELLEEHRLARARRALGKPPTVRPSAVASTVGDYQVSVVTEP
jgi:hypothetical protein